MPHFLIEVPDSITVVNGSSTFSRRESEPTTPESIKMALTVNSYHTKAFFEKGDEVEVRELTDDEVAMLEDAGGF
jgi:hypothetical protein